MQSQRPPLDCLGRLANLVRNSGMVLEKVVEYFHYWYRNRDREDVPDMDIPVELCLELLLAADYLGLDSTSYFTIHDRQKTPLDADVFPDRGNLRSPCNAGPASSLSSSVERGVKRRPYVKHTIFLTLLYVGRAAGRCRLLSLHTYL